MPGFDAQSAARIAKTVQHVERGDRSPPGAPRPKPRRDRPPVILAKAAEDITAGNSGTFDLYGGTPGSETATGEQVEACARFFDINNGDWAWLVSNGLGFYASPAECP